MYDTRAKSAAPIYVSTVKTGKHTDPVWEVCWVAEDLAKVRPAPPRPTPCSPASPARRPPRHPLRSPLYLAKNLNFYSISSDGRVTLWTLSKV